MKLDLSTPEPAPDPKAWEALVAKTGPLDQRLAKLTRTDASGIAYPLVAEAKRTQETPPLQNQRSSTRGSAKRRPGMFARF